MTDLEFEAQWFKNAASDKTKEFGRNTITARIENEKDSEFWNFAFKNAMPDLNVEFYAYSKRIKSGTKGKTQITPLKDFADAKLVLCIDSDYDYLLENTDLQKPVIFQTYVYSLENYWSYAEGLKNILEKTTNTEGVNFDFVAYFRNYSAVIYEWLVCSLYSEKIHDEQLSRENCGKEIGFNKIEMLPAKDSFEILKAQLNTLSEPLKRRYEEKSDFNNFINRVSELGLNQENAYLFVRGHDVFDRVTMPLLKKIGEEITKNRFESLKIAGGTEGLKIYHNFLKNHKYDNYLKAHNKAFQTHPLFERLIADIRTVFN